MFNLNSWSKARLYAFPRRLPKRCLGIAFLKSSCPGFQKATFIYPAWPDDLGNLGNRLWLVSFFTWEACWGKIDFGSTSKKRVDFGQHMCFMPSGVRDHRPYPSSLWQGEITIAAGILHFWCSVGYFWHS